MVEVYLPEYMRIIAVVPCQPLNKIIWCLPSLEKTAITGSLRRVELHNAGELTLDVQYE